MDNKEQFLNAYLSSHLNIVEYLPVEDIVKFISVLSYALDCEKHIFVFGNGGSAANASHFATDLGKGASDKCDKRFKIMSLTDNVPLMTAISNDYDYSQVFLRQLMNFADKGDVAIALSVSGNSPNCVEAIKWARSKKLKTVALVGCGESILKSLVDLPIVVNSKHYGIVEDAHMTICHMVTDYFMENKNPAQRRG